MLCHVLCFPVLFMVGSLESPEIDACYHFTRVLLLCERGTIKSDIYVYLCTLKKKNKSLRCRLVNKANFLFSCFCFDVL